MLQDLRTAIRVIAKDRWLAGAAVVALALGIGVNATVFTLVNAVLIRGLPFPDSSNLYVIGTQRLPADGPVQLQPVSYPELQDWRAQAKSFVDMAAFAQQSMNIADDRGMPEQQTGARVGDNLFRLLGQQPLLGRDFTPGDGETNAEPVVILGNTLWRNRYGSDPAVVGKSIRINGQPAVIVGVMPPGIKFPTRAELWTQVIPTDGSRRDHRQFSVAGRVRPGVSRTQAQTELSGIAARLAAEYPETNKELGAAMMTFNERFNGGEIRTVFLALQGAVAFVLLIACANVANLQLSRSIHRAREVAVRVALGATRLRVIRQLLVESVLLGFVGGALGLLIAVAGVRMFDAAVADVGKPYWIVFTMDYVVFGFLLAVCVLTGILFGIVPAVQISKTNVNDLLKEGGRGNAGSRRAQWLSGTMVVVELALTLVLLVGAGLMVRSFMKLYTADLGIPTDQLMTMRLSLPETKYRDAATRLAFYDSVVPRLEGLAGAEGVAVTTSLPGFGAGRRRMEVDGRPVPTRWEDRPEVAASVVSPMFFRTVSLEMVRGRAFEDRDGTAGAEVLVVDQRFAAEHFAGEDPIGRRIRFVQRQPAPGQQPPVWRTIVGVTRTIEDLPDPGSTRAAGAVYIPLRQEPPSNAGLLVRSRLDPTAVMNAVRREVQAVDPDQPVFTVQTVEQMMAQATWPYRIFGTLFAVFALIALVLSAVGLYAVMAYSVTQRTPEIGVRMALGARGPQVAWMVLRRGLVQVGIGLALGLAGAFGLSQVLASLLATGVPPRDPLTFGSISLLLIAIAAAACLVPARRATRVDPLVALRD